MFFSPQIKCTTTSVLVIDAPQINTTDKEQQTHKTARLSKFVNVPDFDSVCVRACVRATAAAVVL